MTEGATKQTALHGWHRQHGAKMVDFSGWEMPVQYAPGILKEHLATRKFGGLFDVSHMGRFRVRGEDTVLFLQHVLSNNAEALEPWQAQYTLIPNEKGGVIDDAYLYRFGRHDNLLVVNAGNREKDLAHLKAQAERFSGVEIRDDTEKVAMLAFQGPLSGRILEPLLEHGYLPEPRHNSLSEVTLFGTKVLMARTGYTGEPIGFELFVPADYCERVWAKLSEASADRGVLPVGLGGRDTLRLEAGMPLYGHEFGEDAEGKEIPAFAFPLTSVAISFSERKGDFIGREALSRQFKVMKRVHRGLVEPSEVLPRMIRPVALLDKGVIRPGHKAFVGDRCVGWVTSGTVVPYWRFEGTGATMRISDDNDRRPVALAYLDTSLGPEQPIEVEVRGRRLKAQTVRWHGRSEAPPYFRPILVDSEREGQDVAEQSVVGKAIEKAEFLLKRSLDNHEWRQRRCINLIPSEMTPSPLVRLLQVSDAVGRYAEHKKLLAAYEQDVYYYQGADFIEWVERRLVGEMAAFLGCPCVEPRTVSGQMANIAVFSAFVDFKNRYDRKREPRRIRLAMNNHLGKGGHLSSQPMGAFRDYIAKDPVKEKFAVVHFPVGKDNPYKIDVAETANMLDDMDPELFILGKSMVLHPEPVAEIRALVESKTPRPFVMYDMAHVLGLVGPHFQEPFKDGADIVTGSTHKTYFGTQRGIIGTAFEENTPEFDFWKAIQRRSFPGMVSNHHLGSLLGLLMAALEMNAFKDEYQPQVIANAKTFARALEREGVRVEGDPSVDYTETHQVIINVGYANGCQAAEDLEKNNIICNYQALPADESFTASSGLRLGVSEMTRFGMKRQDFEILAELLADVVKRGKDVAEKVAAFRGGFQEMQYCFEVEGLRAFKEKLLTLF